MTLRKHKIARSIPDPHQWEPCAQGFYTPFKSLDQQLTEICSNRESFSNQNTPDREGPPEDPDLLFLSAMADVAPLCRNGRRRVPVPHRAKKPCRYLEEENAEVLRCLGGLVNGETPFELWSSDEYVDGAVIGLSPEIIKKLKHGDFSYQSYIDLHGYNRHEALERVQRFVRQSFAGKLRCILIVSGRGLNSRGREPVLKQELVQWLTHTPLRRFVLAFASARSYDGGAGAFYVLLRRKLERSPFLLPAR